MDNYEQIRAEAKKAHLTPPPSAWNKLEDKLDHRVNRAMNAKRKFVRQLVSLCAVMVLMLTSLYIYQETNKNLDLSKGNIAIWEDLDTQIDQHYDRSKVQVLNAAYQQIDNKVLLKRASW